MPTITPNLSLFIPDNNAPNWGGAMASNLTTLDSASVPPTAIKVVYASGATVEALKPAEAGANVTETRTALNTQNVGIRTAGDIVATVKAGGGIALDSASNTGNLPYNSNAPAITGAIDAFGKVLNLNGTASLTIIANILAASNAASAAQSDATSALTNAATANAAIGNITSDNMLSMIEKSTVILDKASIDGEKTDIDLKAVAFVVSSSAYDAAVVELNRYLGAVKSGTDGVGLGGTDWSNTTSNSAIDGATFRLKFSDLYTKRQLLLNSISAQAKSLADSAQSTANTGVTNAATAQTAANTAQGTANTAVTNAATAQTAANTANTSIVNISSDNILSKGEKSTVIMDKAAIDGEKTDIDSKASTYGANVVNYDASYVELGRYLSAVKSGTDGVGSGGTDWSNSATDSSIDGPTFRFKFSNFYTNRQLLLNAISAQAKVLADAAQTAANNLANGTTTSGKIDFASNQHLNKYAANIKYADNSTIEIWKPAGYNADATGSNTSLNTANVGAQTSATVLANVTSAQLTGTNIVNGVTSIGSGNLFDNSGFELGLTGWGLYNGAGYPFVSLALDTVVKAQATQSVKVAWTSPIANTCGILSGPGVRGGWAPNKTYVISFWALGSGGALGTVPYFGWNTNPNTTIWLQNPPLSTTWQRYVAKIVWAASVEGGGRVYLTVPPCPAGSINLDCMQATEGSITTDYAPSPWEISDGAIAAQTTGNNLISGVSIAGKVNLASGTHVGYLPVANHHPSISPISGLMPAEAGANVTGLWANQSAEVRATLQAGTGGVNLSSALHSGKILAAQMGLSNSDNLIPNPNSEMAAPTGGWPSGAYEAAGISASSYEGTHGRSIYGIAGGNAIYLTAPIPCHAGDSFYLEAMAVRLGSNAGSFWFQLIWLDASGAPFNGAGPSFSAGTSWALASVTGVAPGGTSFVAARISADPGTNPADYLVVDNLYARRMVDLPSLVSGILPYTNHHGSVQAAHDNLGNLKLKNTKKQAEVTFKPTVSAAVYADLPELGSANGAMTISLAGNPLLLGLSLQFSSISGASGFLTGIGYTPVAFSVTNGSGPPNLAIVVTGGGGSGGGASVGWNQSGTVPNWTWTPTLNIASGVNYTSAPNVAITVSNANGPYVNGTNNYVGVIGTGTVTPNVGASASIRILMDGIAVYGPYQIATDSTGYANYAGSQLITPSPSPGSHTFQVQALTTSGKTIASVSRTFQLVELG